MNYINLKRCLSYVLSFSLIFMSSNAAVAATPLQPSNTYKAQTEFSTGDPLISQNMWIADLYTKLSLKRYHITRTTRGFVKVVPNSGPIKNVLFQNGLKPSLTIKSETEEARRNLRWLTGSPNGNGLIAEINRDQPGMGFAQNGVEALNDADEMNLTFFIQDQLNLAYKYGPTLKALLDADKFDEAFKFASQKGLMQILIQPTGLSAIGVTAYTQSRMIAFYQAGSRNYELAKASGMPYKGHVWLENEDMVNRAQQNFRNADFQKIPGFAYFNRHLPEPKSNVIRQALGIVLAVVVSVVTAGIGSAISSGIVSAAGTGVTVGASGAITAGTIGGVSIAAGSVGGTVLTVASNALAGAVVGTVQGQSFGDALASGLIGGAVGSVVGNVANSVGVTDAISGAISNDMVASYVTGVTIGTASGAILNGGDFDAAFSGAASGAATAIAAGYIRENLQQPEAIASESNNASGGLNFSMAEQSQQMHDQLTQQIDQTVGQSLQQDLAAQNLELQANVQQNLNAQAAAQNLAWEQSLQQNMLASNTTALNSAIAQSAYMNFLANNLAANQASINSYMDPANTAYGNVGGIFGGAGTLDVSVDALGGINTSNLTGAAALLNAASSPVLLGKRS